METHYYNAIRARDGEWITSENELRRAEELGLPAETVSQNLAGGVHSWRLYLAVRLSGRLPGGGVGRRPGFALYLRQGAFVRHAPIRPDRGPQRGNHVARSSDFDGSTGS